MVFRIKNNSKMLSTFSAEVYDSYGKLVYTIEEEAGSLWRKIIRLTKFRMALSFNVFVRDVDSNRFFLITRNAGFTAKYFLKDDLGKLICSFKSTKLMFSYWEILDEYGMLLGKYKPNTPFVLGAQKGIVIDNFGELISQFEWERPTFWKTPRECKVIINKYEKPWDIISITSALIKAFVFEKR